MVSFWSTLIYILLYFICICYMWTIGRVKFNYNMQRKMLFLPASIKIVHFTTFYVNKTTYIWSSSSISFKTFLLFQNILILKDSIMIIFKYVIENLFLCFKISLLWKIITIDCYCCCHFHRCHCHCHHHTSCHHPSWYCHYF